MFSLIPLLTVIIPMLNFILTVLAIYTLLVIIKALQIYIRNNSWINKLCQHFLYEESINYCNSERTYIIADILCQVCAYTGKIENATLLTRVDSEF